MDKGRVRAKVAEGPKARRANALLACDHGAG
jgi:hypothetical protein